MKNIKLVAIDLDGTLLTSDKQITSRTIETLKKVVEKGVIVVIATGRPLLGLDSVIKDVPKSPYILATNGARVVNVDTGEVILERLISHDVVLEIFEILEKYDCVKEIFYDGQGYVATDELDRIHLYHKKPQMCDYVRKTRKPIPDILEFIKEKEKSADKAQGIFNNMEIRQRAWQELNHLGKLTLVDSYYYNIEINAKGVEKGSSLRFLAEKLGIDQKEVMAIGDGANDFWMIEYAGVGVAMGNAKDRIKEIADVVTLSNDEDGVAQVLEEYILT